MTEKQTVSLPSYAQGHIRQMQAQINSLQAQLQQFVDGVLCGMGADMIPGSIDIDLENMTATIANNGEGRPSPKG